MGICIPTRYGGAGMGYLCLGLACEELERIDSSLRVVLSVHIGLNSLGLLQWGTEEQQRRWLAPQARGERYATCAMTEPDAGSDVAAMRTTARREGDVYVLNGEKMWISLANVADNFIIFAKTDPRADPPHRGISAFIVERECDEYDVERFLRNAKGACIYEGSSQIHTLLQAQYALGYREDRPLRCELPAYETEK